MHRSLGKLAKSAASSLASVSAVSTRSLGSNAAYLGPDPFQVRPGRVPRIATSAEDAMRDIKSGNRVFVHGAMATPMELLDVMPAVGLANNLQGVEFVHIHTSGNGAYMQDKRFATRNLFTGANARGPIAAGLGDYVPVFLSEIPSLFRRRILPLDVAVLQLSPPDVHGFCSLGVSVDIARAAAQTAPFIIAMINKEMPRTFGDASIHISNINVAFYKDRALPELAPTPPDAVEDRIARYISEELVVDGATLQTGIGAIPDTVLSYLKGHKNLGMHTEMFSDGVISLVESGVIDNSRKHSLKGKVAAGFAMGTKRLYNWIDNNPSLSFHDIEYINNVHLSSKHNALTAINSCIEVDITGSVVSDSIGSRIYSGVGGQVDFIRAASMCDNGKAILALPSRTSKGKSRIAPTLMPGGGVVTTRAHVHHIVTEYGIANLFGKTLRERARMLIDIAHPDDREGLEAEARKLVHLQ